MSRIQPTFRLLFSHCAEKSREKSNWRKFSTLRSATAEHNRGHTGLVEGTKGKSLRAGHERCQLAVAVQFAQFKDTEEEEEQLSTTVDSIFILSIEEKLGKTQLPATFLLFSFSKDKVVRHS